MSSSLSMKQNQNKWSETEQNDRGKEKERRTKNRCLLVKQLINRSNSLAKRSEKASKSKRLQQCLKRLNYTNLDVFNIVARQKDNLSFCLATILV